MQNQFTPTPTGAGSAETPPGAGPVSGGGFNAPSASSKNIIFEHKRLVGFIVIAGLILTAVIVLITLVFFRKPQNGQPQAVESPPFDVGTINKDSELPQTGGE